MKKQFDIKKLVLLNLPYLLMGLFATNFGEAWRLAQGANASAPMWSQTRKEPFWWSAEKCSRGARPSWARTANP